MNKYKALEAMLENILEHDADIETVLAEFPEFSEELRPLLQAAMDAQSAAVPAASDDVMRRGRTHLLKHAAQMRDAAPAPRASFFDFRFATVALTLLLVFFIGGTGLVRASSSALPGDGLYTVKRGWENTRVWFADSDETICLQAEYKEERREEVQELLAYSRVAIIQFEGEITLLNGSKWEVAGVPVIVSEQTDVDASIRVGSDVIVSGRTESDGVVLADKIILSHPENEDDSMTIEAPEEDIDDDMDDNMDDDMDNDSDDDMHNDCGDDTDDDCDNDTGNDSDDDIDNDSGDDTFNDSDDDMDNDNDSGDDTDNDSDDDTGNDSDDDDDDNDDDESDD